MSIDEIYNAREIDDRLLTSGQPTEEQLRAIAADGYRHGRQPRSA